jgi:hypothetical protein
MRKAINIGFGTKMCFYVGISLKKSLVDFTQLKLFKPL